MALREKILIIVMILAVLYGGYTLLDSEESPQTGPAVQQDAQSKTMALSALQVVTVSRLSGLEWYVLETALDSRGRNPFQRLEAIVREREAKPGDNIPEFTYQGFVETHDHGLLVIINGREYQTGDQLDYLGYYLAKAGKDAVIIERRSSTGAVTWSRAINLEDDAL